MGSLACEAKRLAVIPNSEATAGDLFRSTNPRMIELFDDFCDILVELHRPGARFVAR